MTPRPFREPLNALEAVQSIRMAEALNERFGALLSVRRYVEPEEMARSLGEARQIYPEIWSNLDNARADLDRRGIMVGAYDALRATPAANHGAVLDVRVAPRARGSSEKTAHMNREGHTAAALACKILRGALPNVDWDALDRAAASLHPPRWKTLLVKVIAFAALVIAAAGYAYFRIRVQS